MNLEVKREYYHNGQIRKETYLKDGQLHCEDAPAIRCWFVDGKLDSVSYYLNNIELTSKEFLLQLSEENLNKFI